jgi:uncharacterized protein (TIGR04255 family)
MSQDPGNKELAKKRVSFQNPPLIETATSVQFNPLPKLGNAMLALLWNEQFRDEYPRPHDAEPIEPQVERFGEGPPPRVQSMFRIGPFPGSRLMMVSDDDHWMIQGQNGRIVFNWRKLGTGEYPRWEETLPRFEQAYQKLKQFVEAQKLGSIEPDQWEVTYANHLVQGADWKTPQDWPNLVPGVMGKPKTVEGLCTESATGALHLEIEPRRGRLHVELEHGVRRVGDKTEQILVLQLTARGVVEQRDDASLIAGLNLGHSSIVNTFVQITGESAHARWGKHDAG